MTLKQAVHAWKPSKVAKEFCKDEWAKTSPQPQESAKDSLPVTANTWLQVLLPTLHEQLLGLEGNYFLLTDDAGLSWMNEIIV